MIINKVMFSGPRESNSPAEIIEFIKSDSKIDMGIYFTKHACKGTARYDWVTELARQLSQNNLHSTLQFAYEWCEDFCNGVVAPEIVDMLEYTNLDGDRTFKYIQLNFLINQHKIEQDKLIEIIKSYNNHRFILSYNDINKDLIESLTLKGVPFDILYKPFSDIDSPKNNKNFFQGRMLGYSGDFNPDNICCQLDKIYASSYPNSSIYIDTYKSILDDNSEFSLMVAGDFMKNVNNWLLKKSEQKKSV